MGPSFSDYTSGLGNHIDWVRMSPYASSGTFLSRILDGGSAVNWGTISWTAVTPAGTNLIMSVRTGNTSAPDGTWTGFTPITNGASIGLSSRYLQYRLELSTTDASQTPTLQDVTISYTLVTNQAPVAVDDTYSTNEDTQLSVSAPGVLVNDTDADSDPLTAVQVAGPSHGTLALNADGSFTYTPEANWNGADSFTYMANDGTANSNVATVSLTVTPVNDAPVITGQAPLSTLEDTALTVTLGDLLVADVDNTYPTGFSLALQPGSHYTLDGNTLTPEANFNGALTVPVRVNDGAADSNTFDLAVTVTPVNDAPVAVDDSYSTPEDTLLTIAIPGVLGNDTDAESDPLTALKISDPAHGALTLNADGSFSYTPGAQLLRSRQLHLPGQRWHSQFRSRHRFALGHPGQRPACCRRRQRLSGIWCRAGDCGPG